jgi:hypothetical protein
MYNGIAAAYVGPTIESAISNIEKTVSITAGYPGVSQ